MRYYSLNHNSKHTSFKNAVIRGLAPDRGLYFPNQIPILSKSSLKILSILVFLKWLFK